jgi:hypothetical protein
LESLIICTACHKDKEVAEGARHVTWVEEQRRIQGFGGKTRRKALYYLENEELGITLKSIFKKKVGEDWNYLCQVRDKWWPVLIKVTNFCVP